MKYLTACMIATMLLLASIASSVMAEAIELGDRHFFHLQARSEGWHLLQPNGKSFFIRGVHGVRFTGDAVSGEGKSDYQKTTENIYKGDVNAWARLTAARLKAWKFNTVGASSDDVMSRQNLPFVINLNLSASTLIPGTSLPDVFSPAWENAVSERIKAQAALYENNHELIGYFTDNELYWWGSLDKKQNILKVFLNLPPDAPGHGHAIDYLNLHHLTAEEVTQADADNFQKEVAEQYFSVTYRLLKKYDAHHLDLGCRFRAYDLDVPVLEGIKGHVDVVSWNAYGRSLEQNVDDRITRLTNRPWLVTEFSFAATDSGLRNDSYPATLGVVVDTQADRARGVRDYVASLAKNKNSIGYIWFKYSDDPPAGTRGGENFNWGLVDNQDQPWQILVQEFTRTNSR